MRPAHRKRKVTYTEPGHAHFVTYSCYQRLPLLSKDRSRRWVVEAIGRARAKLDFNLWAYVINIRRVKPSVVERLANHVQKLPGICSGGGG